MKIKILYILLIIPFLGLGQGEQSYFGGDFRAYVDSVVKRTSFTGIQRFILHNTSTASATVVGSIYEVRNDNGYWGCIGMTNSGSTIQSSSLINTFHVYNQGYANTLFTVDGNNDFVYYSDPADNHNFSALSNEIMRLKADGDLNVSGNISAEMVRQSDTWHAFGGFEDSAVVISITQSNWAQVTNATGDLFQGVEADGISLSGDTMIFDSTGDYAGNINITYTGTNSNVFQMRIWNVTDGSQVNFKTATTGDGAGDYVTMNLPLYFEVTAGDRYVLQVTNINASNDMTVRFGTFYVSYLHD